VLAVSEASVGGVAVSGATVGGPDAGSATVCSARAAEQASRSHVGPTASSNLVSGYAPSPAVGGLVVGRVAASGATVGGPDVGSATVRSARAAEQASRSHVGPAASPHLVSSQAPGRAVSGLDLGSPAVRGRGATASPARAAPYRAPSRQRARQRRGGPPAAR
jgi:hypothetical protein